jgi:hypothetical protein
MAWTLNALLSRVAWLMAPSPPHEVQVTNTSPVYGYEDLDVKDPRDRVQLAAEGLERLSGMLCNIEYAISRFAVCVRLGGELLILSRYIRDKFVEPQGLDEHSELVERVDLLLQEVEDVLRVRTT